MFVPAFLFLFSIFPFFFLSRDGLWNIKVCYLPPWNSTTSKTFPHLPQEPKKPRFFFFFLTRSALPVFLVSVLLKRQKPLMIRDTRWRDFLPTKWGEKKKTFWLVIDIPASFYYSCDVRPDTLVPETVASHFGWCSNLVICFSLPANHHLAGRNIINLSVNHSSHSQWCRMSVRGSEADMRWLYVQLWHFTPCSLASWWVLGVGEASGFQLHTSVHYGGEMTVQQRVGDMWLPGLSHFRWRFILSTSSAILSRNRGSLRKNNTQVKSIFAIKSVGGWRRLNSVLMALLHEKEAFVITNDTWRML